MTRAAVIDIGTNTLRLLIAEGRPPKHKELARKSVITRLGEGLRDSGQLSEAAISRSVQVLRMFGETVRMVGATEVRATATEAARRAGNAAVFLKAARDTAGLEVEIIGAEDEGRLAFLGATYALPHAQPVLLIDIGGGSTEVIRGDPGMDPEVASLPVGSVSLTEQFLLTDPPTVAEVTKASSYFQDVLSSLPEAPPDALGVAVAGTATTLAAVDQKLEPYDRRLVHGYILDRDILERLQEQFLALTLEERRRLPGIEPKRADVIVAGTLILTETLAWSGFREFRVSEQDLLDGLLIDLLQDGPD